MPYITNRLDQLNLKVVNLLNTFNPYQQYGFTNSAKTQNNDPRHYHSERSPNKINSYPVSLHDEKSTTPKLPFLDGADAQRA